MSRLAIPLQDRKLWATGDVLVRGELPLLLKDKRGAWKRRTFLADSGSEMTTMPAALGAGWSYTSPKRQRRDRVSRRWRFGLVYPDGPVAGAPGLW